MDSTSAISSNPLYSMIAMAASTPGALPSSTASGDAVSPAATLELSSVQMQGQLMSSLLSSVSPPTSAMSSLFAGGSTLSALNAQGSAAMAYLTPQSIPLGQTVNRLA